MLFTFSTFAKLIQLTLASVKGEDPNFYYELLEKALALQGHQLTINYIGDVPNSRISKWLDSGKISLHWYLETSQRNQRYLPIKVNLTNYLAGSRALLIPKGTQGDYNQVKNLTDFQRLNKIAGFGKGWFDADIWAYNQLPYVNKDIWQNIPAMISKGGRGIDYLSLGVNHISEMANSDHNLVVEQNLLLLYERDFIFYLSKHQQAQHYILLNALQHAEQSGLITQLIDKHWSKILSEINFKQRTAITLATPAL